jgi:hypothetical protein
MTGGTYKLYLLSFFTSASFSGFSASGARARNSVAQSGRVMSTRVRSPVAGTTLRMSMRRCLGRDDSHERAAWMIPLLNWVLFSAT